MRRILMLALALALLAVVAMNALAQPKNIPTPPALVGKITDAGGRGIAGAKITLYGGAATRFEGQTATTNEKGEYAFDPLSTGQLQWDAKERRWHLSVGMRIVHSMYSSVDGETWWEIAADVPEGGEHRHDLRFAKGGKIKGQVLNARGDFPAGDLSLKFEREDHSGTSYARTDHRGRFESESLAPGEYVILWNSPLTDYMELARVPVQRERASQTTIRITVSVTAKATTPSYELIEGEK